MSTINWKIYALVLRAGAVAVVAGLLVFLVYQALAPEGSVSTTSFLIRPAPFISEPKPADRLATPVDDGQGGTARPLLDSPLYLDVTPPSSFDSISMKVSYINKGGSLLELGALASTIDEQFELRPADNRLLDQLPWNRVVSGQLTLLERVHRYASIDEFISRPPDMSRLAVYRTKVDMPYRLAGYQPSTAAREIEVSLRGRHRLLTYVQGEPLNFTFQVQDMNRQEGADPVIVSVYRFGEKEPFTRSILDDDGNTKDDQRSSKLRTVAVSVTGPAPGVYQIEFTASNDVFIRRIMTSNRKLVFADRIYLGDHVGYSDKTDPLTVYLDGQGLVARAAHLESLQTLSVEGKPLELGEPQTRYIRRLSAPGLVPVVSPRRDVLLESDGLFALSKEDFFDPLPFTVDEFTEASDLAARGIDFILTGYEPPETDGLVSEAQATFSVSGLARTADGAYRFAVLAPDIVVRQQDLQLISVTFTFNREPVTWRNALTRLTKMFSSPSSSEPLVLPDGTSYDESPQ
jgi:hypothetical protein